jgi:hypothetical protein
LKQAILTLSKRDKPPVITTTNLLFPKELLGMCAAHHPAIRLRLAKARLVKP